MCESRSKIRPRPGSKIGQPDGLSRHSGEEKTAMDAMFLEEGLLLDMGEGENEHENNDENVEVEGIDVSKWHKRNGLCLDPEEHILQVLRQHHDGQVAGHWGRHRTQELSSYKLIWHRWSEDVANYVAGCMKCQKSKADRHSRQTKLVPMPTGERLS